MAGQWKGERRVGRGVCNGHGSGARECEWREGGRNATRCVGVRERTTCRYRGSRSISRAGRKRGWPASTQRSCCHRSPRPNPGHCSHRFNRYSLSALGSFPKTPGRVSRPMPRYLGVLARYPAHLTIPPLPSSLSLPTPEANCEKFENEEILAIQGIERIRLDYFIIFVFILKKMLLESSNKSYSRL